MKKRLKVFVGMSGGVDSSVSATLLKRRGFDVVGVFIKAWHPDFLPCDWKSDRRDAMRVCARLDIPFLTLDLEKEYKKEVVDYMIREYRKGRTPNPDVMCNKEIKFGAFLKYAKKMRADFVATGHYAQNILNGKRFELKVSKDKNKDQTYFLWTLSQKQLSRIIFPVGGLKKSQVRNLAKKFNLPNATKKDSQGLCFLGKINMKDFLSNYIEKKRGVVKDSNGKNIGFHNGASFFTIGQRHGFTVKNEISGSAPLYVIGKDLRKNTITVSTKEPNRNDNKTKIKLDKVNWISEMPKLSKKYSARIRYRQKLLPITLEKLSGKWVAQLNTAELHISLGQSIVIYDGLKCIGGGVIGSFS